MQVNIAVNVTVADDNDEVRVPVQARRNSGGVVRASSRRYAFGLAAAIRSADVREHAIEFIERGTPGEVNAFIRRMAAVTAAR